MKTSALIEQLQVLVEDYGDLDVFLDVTADGLLNVGEVDVDGEATVIIIWKAEDTAPTMVCPRCDLEYKVGGCNECPYCGHEHKEVNHAA